ncbi:MAG: sporulation integral membrane protein YtvI [Bacillaceae bacterium G1]|nr:MAG: sporulation integral membrane protein YtvI [Bacillaceae bacterium G1]
MNHSHWNPPWMRWLWGALLIVGGYFIFPYLLPFLIALLLAVLIEPLVQAVQKTGIRSRIAATWIVLGGLGLFLGLVIYFSFTRIFVELVAIYEKSPYYLTEVENWVSDWLAYIPPETLETLQRQVTSSFSNWLSNSSVLLGRSASAFVNFASALPGMIILSLLTFLAFVLISMHLPQLKAQFYQWFAPESHEKLDIILRELNRGIIGYIRGQVLIAVVIFAMTFVGLLLLRVPYALAIAAVIAVVDFLPFLGSGLVLLPWAVWALFKHELFFGIGLIVVYVAITLLRRIIEPKVLGDSLGISTLAVLLSMVLGFSFMGVLGLLVGPAVAVVLKAFRKAGFFQFQIRL